MTDSNKRWKQICTILFLIVCLQCLGSFHTIHAAKTVTMVVGETKQLKKSSAKWSSGKRSVASVSRTGLVTALKKGSCRITARTGKKKTIWKIKVEAPKLNKTRNTIAVGKSFSLKMKNTTKKFKWSVSDPSILKIDKKGRNKVKVSGLKNGTAIVFATKGTCILSCTVVVGTGVQDDTGTKDSSGIQTLYLDGNVFKQMTWNRTDTAKYVSNISRYGQSAPLYTHKDGGDGLENIWANTNNGAVGLNGVKLSPQAVQGTIDKACLWARAVADSPYHGYDYGHSYPEAALMYTFGQAKANALGTGDYCCSASHASSCL